MKNLDCSCSLAFNSQQVHLSQIPHCSSQDLINHANPKSSMSTADTNEDTILLDRSGESAGDSDMNSTFLEYLLDENNSSEMVANKRRSAKNIHLRGGPSILNFCSKSPASNESLLFENEYDEEFNQLILKPDIKKRKKESGNRGIGIKANKLFLVLYLSLMFLFIYVSFTAKPTELQNEDSTIEDTPEYISINPFGKIENEFKWATFCLAMLMGLCGLLSISNFHSLYMQKFSVPELSTKKIEIQIMHMTGIIGCFCMIGLGCSVWIQDLEKGLFFEGSTLESSNILFLMRSFFFLVFITVKLLLFIRLRKLGIYSSKYNSLLKSSKVVNLMYLVIFIVLLNLYFIQYSQVSFAVVNDDFKEIISAASTALLTYLPYILLSFEALSYLQFENEVRFLELLISFQVNKDYFLNH